MSDVQFSDLRRQLAEEQTRLRQQVQSTGAARGPGELAFDEGFADTGQVTAERSEVETLTNTLLETLADVEIALGKFENGTFGTCETCGEAIPAPRLEAMPAARYCITCAPKRR